MFVYVSVSVYFCVCVCICASSYLSVSVSVHLKKVCCYLNSSCVPMSASFQLTSQLYLQWSLHTLQVLHIVR